jgi:hypothetical protein
MVALEVVIAYSTYMEQQVIPKPGQRVECVLMDPDPNPIAPGTRGTVTKLDQWGVQHMREYNIHVAWDNGRTLALLSDVDKWKVLSAESCTA